MVKILNQDEVTLTNLASHLEDSGIIPTAITEDAIWLRTVAGIAYRVSILDDKKFLCIGTYLPLGKERSDEDKREFERRMNADIFLPVFSLDADDDLTVSYLMPYLHGIIAGQFTAMVTRFASLLDYIVSEHNENGIIDFGSRSNSTDNTSDEVSASTVLPSGVLVH